MSEENNTPTPPPNGEAPKPIGIDNAALLAELDEFGDADPASAYLAKQLKGETKDAKSGGGDPAGGGDDSETPADGDAAGDADSADGDASGASEEADAENEAEEVEEGADSEEEPPADDDKPDPVAAKRIEAIQKAEKESKARLAQERQEAERMLERRRSEYEAEIRPRLEKAEKYEKLVERLDLDPVSYAAERGWSKEQKLYFAEQLFADAKSDDDPKYREHRQRRMREQESTSKLSALEKRNQELEGRWAEFEASQKVEKEATKGLSIISDKTPVLQRMLKANREFTEGRVKSAIDYIRKQTGQVPSASDVIAQLEEVEAAELRSRGVDLPTASPKKPPGTNGAVTKQKTQDAGERKTAKTVVKKPITPPPNAPPPDRDQLLKELEELDRN